jgi:hypothetical protein
MIWFLLLSVVNSQPVLTSYTDQNSACVAFAAAPGSHVYQVEDKRGGAVISEGDCKPVVQFNKK